MAQEPTNPTTETAPELRQSLQDYLSIGYLYLLVLEIISDSILYSYVGINIVDYSTILDILLSPVAYLTKGPLFAVIILVIPLATVLLTNYQIKQNRKKGKRSNQNLGTRQSLRLSPGILKIIAPAFIILSAYIGYALGRGVRLQDQVESGKIEVDHVLTFRDNEQLEVLLIGNNSQYVFFIEPGEKEVSVSPIPGTIKKITQIETKEE